MNILVTYGLLGFVIIVILSGCSTDPSLGAKDLGASQLDAASAHPPQGAHLSPRDAARIAATRLEQQGYRAVDLTAPLVSYLGPQRSLLSVPHKLWLVTFSVGDATASATSSTRTVGV